LPAQPPVPKGEPPPAGISVKGRLFLKVYISLLITQNYYPVYTR
jgi:hypothetical protein